MRAMSTSADFTRSNARFRGAAPSLLALPWKPSAQADRCLSTSHRERIYYRTRNERSWKPALVRAGIVKVLGLSRVAVGTRPR